MKPVQNSPHRDAVADAAGATTIEYAILSGLIAAVVILSVQALGIETGDMLCSPLSMLEQVGVDVTADCG